MPDFGIPNLAIGKSLDKQKQSVADAIASQNGMIKTEEGNNPAIDYIVKKQTEANDSSKAKLPFQK